MTHYIEFEKAVKHVKDCLFWDFVDGVWNDVIVTPLDRDYFNRLMQQVSDAHVREVETLNAENAKLRELLDFALPIAMYAASTEEGDRMRELMREIGE